MLSEASDRAADRCACVVGVATDAAAGGVILRDFFQGEDGARLEHPALQDMLVVEKLQAETKALVADGSKWIEVAADLPYGYSHSLLRLGGDPWPLTDEQSSAHAALLAAYRALEEEYSGQDEYPEEIDARLGQFEMAMEALEQRPPICDPVEVSRAGVFVTQDREGSLAV
jgi:ParB family transcriptional regulator, chromosome partitioning protein